MVIAEQQLPSFYLVNQALKLKIICRKKKKITPEEYEKIREL